jgi:flagellar hook-associated protein 1 FlgK
VPISSFYGLQTSLRGLLAHQRSLDVTSHNVANASTVGYSRQSADLTASTPMDVASGALASGAGAQLGTGVDVQAYRRIRDTFLDVQYRAQNTRLGEATARAQGLDQAQTALNEPGDSGISAQLSKFWTAWSTLSNNPDDVSARTALVQQAASLSDAFKAVDQQLGLAAQSAQDELTSLTGPDGQVKQAADQLAKLNDSIRKITTAGEQPNDLLDARDKLLDQLSELGQTSVEDLGDGSVRVTFGGAGDPPLVDGTTVNFPPPLSAPAARSARCRSSRRSPAARSTRCARTSTGSPSRSPTGSTGCTR